MCVCVKSWEDWNFLPTFVTDFSTPIFLKFLLNFKYPELGERERKRERNDFIYAICTYREHGNNVKDRLRKSQSDF